MIHQKNSVYKTIMMLLFIGLTAATLNQYAKLIQHLINVKYDWKFELVLVIGQLIFQLPFVFRKTGEQKIDYYYNMLVVSTLGSITLFPLIIFNHFLLVPTFINIVYFFIVVLLMFFDHKRRVTKLDLPNYISYTWAVYRFLILIFILV